MPDYFFFSGIPLFQHLIIAAKVLGFPYCLSAVLTHCKMLLTEEMDISFFFKYIFLVFFRGLQYVGHSFAYVAHFGFLKRHLDSNPESCRSKQARFQPSQLSPYLIHPSP
jgi:hypothetical protein